MVKEATKRNSPFAAVRRGSPSHSPRTLRRITGFRKEPQELSQPKNILTAFARCTVEKCLNKKQPGTPRCRWHNRWLYKVPADTMCAMFEHKLAGISSENDASNANISPQTALENQRICAAQSLEASQENLCNALKKEHLKHGVSFDWPDQKFVDKRIKELQTFVAAVAREIVQPTGFLDISDSFAIDAVVERMYMVRMKEQCESCPYAPLHRMKHWPLAPTVVSITVQCTALFEIGWTDEPKFYLQNARKHAHEVPHQLL